MCACALPGAGPRPLPAAMAVTLLFWVAAVALGQARTPTAATPARTPVPAYRQANTIAVLTVEGPIDGITLRSLERRVRQALDDGAEAIVLDIDTPGGALEPTLDICHLIRTEAPTNTVAWINPQAYSAGTIIALACREIVVAPYASFGDAAPISPLGPIPLTERAKLESPILAEVIHSARRNHYDENLVQAFISVGVELWMIENVNTGERVFVDRGEYEAVIGEEAPAELTSLSRPARPPNLPPGQPATPWFQKLAAAEPVTGEPPDPDQLKKEIEFQQDLPPSRPRLTRDDRGDWKPLRHVVRSTELLVLKHSRAIEYGLATKQIKDEDELKAYFGAQSLQRYDRVWSESLAQFLVHPIVRGVLLVIFVVCLLIELAAPGVGVFGATAAVSLLIVIGAPWMAGMAQWWEILLIALGLGLIAVELFVIPGFGVAGVAGAACMLVGLVGTFVSDSLATEAGQSDLLKGLIATFTAMAAAGVAAWLLFRQLDTVPVFGRFILRAQLGETAGAGGTGGGLLESIGASPTPLEAGDIGVAETDLRPAGRANFDGRPVDVKSVGDYIDRGRRVRVVSVGRFAIEVEEAQ